MLFLPSEMGGPDSRSAFTLATAGWSRKDPRPKPGMSDLCGHLFGGARRAVILVRVGAHLRGGGAGGLGDAGNEALGQLDRTFQGAARGSGEKLKLACSGLVEVVAPAVSERCYGIRRFMVVQAEEGGVADFVFAGQVRGQ